MPTIKWLLLLVPLIWLTGCGDPLQAKIETQVELVDMQMNKLTQRLENGQIRNANLIREYARQLQTMKPEYATIVNELARDATSRGPIYTNLVDRIDAARVASGVFSSPEERLRELENLYQAASPELFNDALSDPLNVLADLSQGQLARVNAISREASLAANGAQDFGAGSQLIGNPAYGNWQTGSNGMSFWEWYGMYALISNIGDMFDSRRRVYYGDWSRGRNYSYYHDYGRYRYSSPNQIRKQQQTEQRAAKNYRGGKFTSAYAKSRTGASRVSSSSLSSQRASKMFQSSYAKKPTTSVTNSATKSTNNPVNKSYSKPTTNKSSYGFNSSFRSSKSSSRGGFGGK
ncbi:hypothetical protein C2869_10275 [Saccharobesus litoralis]|uniref:Uncharacterized protein n=1 Tax=Saccharobesus litoralis TaxID=2172099 RepID=A0A2S0VRG1_9ALTE|nr:hypothetical protein [Saccharobesus litoralis]AWB66789.1 hypothetical protein C2869_10275 [Saccharobesus litoralis]